MSYKTDDINKLFEQSFNCKEIKINDIPNIDLYIDQIIKIFEDKLSDVKSDDKLITKSMVNNYSKEKLIAPVKGKKYTREQIFQILLIFNLKGILSIQDIKKITNTIMLSKNSEDSMMETFNHYEDNSKYTDSLCKLICDNLINKFDEKITMEELTSVLLSISQVCNMLKHTAELITDKFYNFEEQ